MTFFKYVAAGFLVALALGVLLLLARYALA